jgi:hypothetical protein
LAQSGVNDATANKVAEMWETLEWQKSTETKDVANATAERVLCNLEQICTVHEEAVNKIEELKKKSENQGEKDGWDQVRAIVTRVVRAEVDKYLDCRFEAVTRFQAAIQLVGT